MKRHLKLDEIPKRQLHQVPDGYFDRLPMRIMERTASRQPKAAPGTPAWLWQQWRPLQLALAPVLLLVLFIGVYFLGMQQAPQQETVPVALLSKDEMVEYLDLYANLEFSDLEEHLEADQLLAADFLNISPTTAEEELYYYQLDDIDY